MDKERRRAPRISSTVEADLYDPQGHAVIGEGHFVNLSETGAQLESSKELRVRQTVRLHLQAAGHTALELTGKVVWSRKRRPGFAYGISFARRAAPKAA